MKRKWIYSLAACFMSLIMLGGCAGVTDSGTQAGGEHTDDTNTVVIADTQGPTSPGIQASKLGHLVYFKMGDYRNTV